MKRVLIPTDFSENALNALNYAKALFKNSPCTFYLLNAFHMNPALLVSEEYNTELTDAYKKESEKGMVELLYQTESKNKNHEHHFKSISKSSSIVHAVNGIAALENIDYIIMGTKGAKNALEVFLGSNAVKIIKGVDDCPVIVVPKDYNIKIPKQIVFSTNFNHEFDENELKPLLVLAKLWKAKLKIVQVMEEDLLDDWQKVNKERIKHHFAGLDHFFHKINFATSETDAIRDFVEQTQSDMISLVNHKHNFLRRFTEENVVKKVSFDSPVPVLILPELV
mgnify:CR=1 FL=1